MTAVPTKMSVDANGRTFYLLDLETFESWPEEMSLASSRYVVGMFADADAADTEVVSEAISRGLHSGAVYICAWGRNCELVHDLADEIIVARELETGRQEDVVMTTWHADDTLVEALWFFANLAVPAEDYAANCSSWLAVRIGKYREDSAFEELLADLGKLDRAAAAGHPE